MEGGIFFSIGVNGFLEYFFICLIFRVVGFFFNGEFEVLGVGEGLVDGVDAVIFLIINSLYFLKLVRGLV